MTLKEKHVVIDDGGIKRKLAYASWGDENNERVLVCVHGLSRNGRDFDFLAKELESKYRVICPDIVGRGNSDWLDNKKKYNYATYVADVLQLLSRLNISKTDWVGTSMGGIIGMIIAAQKPELINKLVLNDIGSFVSGEALDRIYDYVGVKPEFDSYEKAAKHLKARMSTFGVSDENHWQHICEHTIEKLDGNFTFRYDAQIVQKLPLITRILGNIKSPRRIGKCPDVNLNKFWDVVTCPVFVINGESSDILSEETYNKMLNSKDNVQGVRVKGVGHAPMLMDDEQIEYVKSWLG